MADPKLTVPSVPSLFFTEQTHPKNVQLWGIRRRGGRMSALKPFHHPAPPPRRHNPQAPRLRPCNSRNSPPLLVQFQSAKRTHQKSSSNPKNPPSVSITAIPLPDPPTRFDGTNPPRPDSRAIRATSN